MTGDESSPSVAPEKRTSLTAALAVVGEATNASGGGIVRTRGRELPAVLRGRAKPGDLGHDRRRRSHGLGRRSVLRFCGFCTAGSASPELVREVTRRLDVAWLRHQLLADAAMDAWLDTPPNAATLAITRR